MHSTSYGAGAGICAGKFSPPISAIIIAALVFVVAQCLSPGTAFAQFVQQGDKIEGSLINWFDRGTLGVRVSIASDGNTAIVGATGDTFIFTRSNGVWDQGSGIFTGAPYSVALSADGNTAIIGTGSQAAGYAFGRNGNSWTQRGNPLIGSNQAHSPIAARSSALSADGNTIIIGSWDENAAWIFSWNGSDWVEESGKLTGDSVGDSFGASVALSADGNTAVVGGNGDNSGVGAVWVFTRSGSTWSPQGGKLIGNTPAPINFGSAVALSADGNTLIAGGSWTNSNAGGAWVFVRSGVTWGQQAVLLGTGATGSALQGSSVGLSADGNTALVGGQWDDGTIGAVWIFTRGGTSWTQQGGKLVGGNANGAPQQGSSAGLSGDGNTAIVGGYNDNFDSGSSRSAGAIWFFVQNPGVDSVVANGGPNAGGTNVTINGSRLGGTFAVTFGGVAATNVVVVDDNTVTATTPAHAGGVVDVVVSTQHGSVTASGAFTYFGIPTISIVSPSGGPLAGNTSVTITGNKLTGATAVTFGGSAGTNLIVHSTTRLTVKTPAHAVGAVDVVVTTPGGIATEPNGFTYYATPAITAINPNQGPASGGTLVSIVGTDLTGATGVKFGATAASSFSVINATHAIATAPPHAVGIVNVTLMTPGGTTGAVAGAKFRYTMTPVRTVIARFAGGKNDGSKPVGGLVADVTGALYGTTSAGGSKGLGTIFKLTPSGNTFTKTILHQFDGPTGATPFAGLVIDRNKNLYGVTTAGGANNAGVIFKLAGAAYTVLHHFQSTTDGGVPYATLARDSAGVLYGATTVGGSKGKGTTFTFKEPGAFNVTHAFAGGTDGDDSQGAILLDANKNAYGTTIQGGRPNLGIVYKIAPNGTRTILHTFAGRFDGRAPRSGLYMKGSTLFGTTFLGGRQNQGSVFQVVPPSTADEVLFSFTGPTGANPAAGVAGDAAGILYGTTSNGGANGLGTVFKLIPPANGQTAWTESVIYSFHGDHNDGALPKGPVLLGKNRTIYGTTNGGGSSACTDGCGTVFMVQY